MGKITEHYAELVFTKKEMKKRLSASSFDIYNETLVNGKALDESIADDVAHAIKEWALENEATHFSHWFQPQRSGTAEKHDAFIAYDENGDIIEKFTKSQLIQSEPDASSFPSGGIRSTFEARGYTAWDPTSPVFLRDAEFGRSLIIPSIYMSWTGEALDMKTPLIRSIKALNDEAIKLQKLLGNRNAKRITVYSGLEQEYFLISEELAALRPDLEICGRTLFGAPPVKGQSMEDHYFGAIKTEIMDFMNDLDFELHRNGIPVKTKHNEVAPNQFELAPLYEEMNLAIDHNLQIMDIIQKVAQNHGFKVLLHEKPFAGLNGSGKHMNWSIGDNTGANYLEPSRSPLKNISFLMTLAALLLGVQKYSGLLMSAILDANNEHRLGSHEAPPAIISIYLGDYLTEILDHIEGTKTFTEKDLNYINHGLEVMPRVVKDISDRNRTSPIAFTGNKFELRAVGSSANPAEAAKVMNCICAYGFRTITERLEKKKGDVKNNALQVLKEILKETKDVRFEGNNYSQEWKKEAKKRKLFFAETAPEAIHYSAKPECIELYESLNVLSKREVESRTEIKLEAYSNTKTVELKQALSLVRRSILPAILDQLQDVALAHKGIIDADMTSKALKNDLKILEALYSSIQTKETYLGVYLESLVKLDDSYNKASDIAAKGLPLLQSLREDVDKAERRVSADYWRLPTYDELLV